jgi:hypothetical protein
MFHPTLMPMLVKERQDNLLKEVKKSRGLKSARTARPGLQERLFTRVGDCLISAGLRLQARYQPATYPGTKACQSDC